MSLPALSDTRSMTLTLSRFIVLKTGSQCWWRPLDRRSTRNYCHSRFGGVGRLVCAQKSLLDGVRIPHRERGHVPYTPWTIDSFSLCSSRTQPANTTQQGRHAAWCGLSPPLLWPLVFVYCCRRRCHRHHLTLDRCRLRRYSRTNETVLLFIICAGRFAHIASLADVHEHVQVSHSGVRLATDISLLSVRNLVYLSQHGSWRSWQDPNAGNSHVTECRCRVISVKTSSAIFRYWSRYVPKAFRGTSGHRISTSIIIIISRGVLQSL